MATNTTRRSRRTRGLLFALSLSLLGSTLAGAAHGGEPGEAGRGFAVGIVDATPNGDMFSHPAWSGLNVVRARTLAPWNVALRDRQRDGSRRQFEHWLQQALAHNVEPYVTLWLGYAADTEKCPNNRCRVPSAREYEHAFRAFRVAYPSVRLIGPWNEPNYDDRTDEIRRYYTPDGSRRLNDPDCPRRVNTDNCGPLAAAFYWRIAKQVCGNDCTPIAGEFTGRHDARAQAYVDRYKTYLRSHRPNVWAIHPYTDANRFQREGDRSVPATNFLYDNLQGSWATANDGRRSQIWLSAIGAYWRDGKGRVHGDASQRDTMAFIMRIPTNSRAGESGRVTRLYVYNFQNVCAPRCPTQDRGLLAPAGATYDTPDRIRPAYYKVRDRDGTPGR